jgi:S-adenosylmethionine:tRNA ribosyltransferase-isomerase
MVLNRADRSILHHHFRDIPTLLDPTDLLVLNNTKVFPARLFGFKSRGQARIEVLLLRELETSTWEALVRPGKRLKPGHIIAFSPGKFEAEVLADIEGTSKRVLRFSHTGLFWDWIEKMGRVPLPPYIQRKTGSWQEHQSDSERYQTVYAKARGSVAAPTAGLHFSSEILEQFHSAEITLHVGYGTFRPVSNKDIRDHQMDEEFYSIPRETACRIRQQKRLSRRVVAVGTTTTRALESVTCWGSTSFQEGWTNLFIYPGHTFRVVDGLLTNFHLPESTLLMLVAAFAGLEFTKYAYSEAILEKYRFYSYGDAMLIL